MKLLTNKFIIIIIKCKIVFSSESTCSVKEASITDQTEIMGVKDPEIEGVDEEKRYIEKSILKSSILTPIVTEPEIDETPQKLNSLSMSKKNKNECKEPKIVRFLQQDEPKESGLTDDNSKLDTENNSYEDEPKLNEGKIEYEKQDFQKDEQEISTEKDGITEEEEATFGYFEWVWNYINYFYTRFRQLMFDHFEGSHNEIVDAPTNNLIESGEQLRDTTKKFGIAVEEE